MDKSSALADRAVLQAREERENLTMRLDEIYETLEDTFYSKRGYLIPRNERSLIDKTGGSAVYGEILGEGIENIVSKLDLGAASTFVDLGSGLGRAVFQIALRTQAHCIGIELSDTRQQQARWVLERLSEQYADMSRACLRTDDITQCSLEGGTHFLLLSTAFSASGCRMIADRLSKTSTFQVLITSRPLPPTALIKIAEFGCSYSWNLKGTAHVYCKPGPDLPHGTLAAFYSDQGIAYLPSNQPWLIPIAEGSLPNIL